MRLTGRTLSVVKDVDCVAFTRGRIIEVVDIAIDGVSAWPEALATAFGRWDGGSFEYKNNSNDDWSDISSIQLTPIKAERGELWRIVEELPNEVHAPLPPRLGHTRPLWRNMQPILVENGHMFAALFRELEDDGSRFHNNMNILVDAMRDGSLYTLQVVEGERTVRPSEDPIFVADAFLTLPCLAVVDEDICSIIWVHSRARRLGLGRALVEGLDIQRASKPLPQGRAFFNACNVDHT